MKSALRRVWHKLVYRYGKRGALLIIVPLALAIGGGGTYAALLLGSGGQGSVNLQSGLIGWWKLNGNATDSSSYARNGSITGSPTVAADRGGSPNGAYSFSGTGQYISVANYDSTVMKQGQEGAKWTLSVWTTGGSQNGILFGKVGFNGGILQNGNTYTFSLWSSAPGSLTINKPSNDTSKWHLLTAVYDAGTMYFYVDGQLAGSRAGPTTMYDYGNTLGIASGGSNNWLSDATLDDARVYNRALNTSEISALYSQYDSKLNLASGQNGLVARWNLDGNGNDVTPYSDNLTLVGGATYADDRHGKANGALSLTSAGDYAEKTNINSAARFNDSKSFSLSAWIKPTTVSGLQTFIGQQRGTFIVLDSNGNKLRLALDDTAAVSTGTLSAGVWQHVAATYDGSTHEVVLYINGQADGPPSVTYDGSGFGAASYWFVGYESRFSDQFTGSIDDARIYNRVLSATEVASLYNTYDAQINLYGNGGSTGGGSSGAGLVGKWMFNGNAKDDTPYGNNGTVSGATLVADRHGYANSAYSFTGPDYITLNRTPQLSSNVLTYCAWIYPTNTSGTTETIFGPGASSGPQLRISSGQLQFLKASVISIGYSSGTVAQNTWNHVCVTYSSSGGYAFYINGLPSGSGTNLQTFSFPANPLIGIRTISTEPFHGYIDDVRVYSRALSAGEIQSLYNQ